jgi:hypothetical protein
VPLLDHDPSGYEDGLPRERDPSALQHHAQEHDQVPILPDQREDLVYGLQASIILLT